VAVGVGQRDDEVAVGAVVDVLRGLGLGRRCGAAGRAVTVLERVHELAPASRM